MIRNIIVFSVALGVLGAGGVFLSSASAQEPVVNPRSAGDLYLQVYDVRDLAEHLGETGYPPDEEERPLEEIVAAGTEGLANAILQSVGSGIREAKDVQLLKGGKLAVRGTEASQEWIRGMLTELRKSWGSIVTIEVVVFRCDPRVYDGLGFENGAPLLLDNQRMAAMRDNVEKTDGVDVTFTPTLSLFPVQKGSVAITRDVSYVAGYDRYENVLPKNQVMVIPRIEKLPDGLTVTTTAIPSAEGWELSFKAEVVEFVEPPMVRTTPLGDIVDPVVRTRAVASVIVLREGSGVYFPAGEMRGDKLVIGIALTDVSERLRIGR